ncbi:type II toxin-antitoxin system RelE/ParE family toxin [Sphingomonas bacterium]|uniref:type II toxin-antitoxin system RelE/ParE family toxin n=1 Tax=Sphingomonas bacterium TaxID=1895847 RepID=UPI0020C73604
MDLTEIYDFTRRRWNERQADRYISGLFATFRGIAEETASSRVVKRVSADARVSEYESHLIYWRIREDGNVGIVAVLHGRMDQVPRARRAFGAAGRD